MRIDDPMLWILLAIIVWEEVRFLLVNVTHSRQVSQLQRLTKAETLNDFVAAEAVLTRKPKKPGPARGPGLYDDMFGTTPRKE